MITIKYPTYDLNNFSKNSMVRIASLAKVLVNQLIVVDNKIKSKSTSFEKDFKKLISLLNLLNAEIDVFKISIDEDYFHAYYEYMMFIHERYFETNLIINIVQNDFVYIFYVTKDLNDSDFVFNSICKINNLIK